MNPDELTRLVRREVATALNLLDLKIQREMIAEGKHPSPRPDVVHALARVRVAVLDCSMDLSILNLTTLAPSHVHPTN